MSSIENITLETIQKRRSVRTFRNQPLSEADQQKIKTLFANESLQQGPFGNRFQFVSVPVKGTRSLQGRRLGTYGFISNPQAYLTAICENETLALVDFGYVFEQYLLLLTDMGLGTCWLGGSFNRKNFGEELNLSQDGILPAVSPVGYASDPRLVERGMRAAVGATNRKPWEALFYQGDFEHTLTSTVAGNLAAAFEAVRLGPSASNKQPWRLVRSEDGKRIHFYLALTPGYSDNYNYNMQLLDIGIAICHFEHGARLQGISGSWQEQNPELSMPFDNYQYIASFILA